MKPYASIGGVDLYLGDCREVALGLEHFAHVVSDPPYGLSFMGAGWDQTVPGPDFWTAICSRMLPGGSVFAFGGTRQFHRLACALEDAGLEVRDCLAWLHGQGFPKSYNIGEGVGAEASKVYDPARHRKPSPVGLSEGERQFVDWIRNCSKLTAKDLRRLVGCDRFWTGEEKIVNTVKRTKPPVWARCALVPTPAAWAKMRAAMAELGVTPPEAIEELVKSPPNDAQERFMATISGGAQRGRPQGGNEWDGYGTGLKPAWEPIVWASKAMPGTYAQNAIEHGVAGLNIDGGRIGAGLAFSALFQRMAWRFDQKIAQAYGATIPDRYIGTIAIPSAMRMIRDDMDAGLDFREASQRAAERSRAALRASRWSLACELAAGLCSISAVIASLAVLALSPG